MNTEIKHKNVYEALAAAQADMGPVKKGSVNPHYKSKYADLADVMQSALPALNAHGLCLWHSFTGNQQTQERFLRTTVSHGETDTHIHCDVPLVVNKEDMQGLKSAVTYAKRIGAESLTGIAPEDDDGNAAAEATKYTGTDKQRQMLKGIMDQTGIVDETLMKQIAQACVGQPMRELRRIAQEYARVHQIKAERGGVSHG